MTEIAASGKITIKSFSSGYAYRLRASLDPRTLLDEVATGQAPASTSFKSLFPRHYQACSMPAFMTLQSLRDVTKPAVMTLQATEAGVLRGVRQAEGLGARHARIRSPSHSYGIIPL